MCSLGSNATNFGFYSANDRKPIIFSVIYLINFSFWKDLFFHFEKILD